MKSRLNIAPIATPIFSLMMLGALRNGLLLFTPDIVAPERAQQTLRATPAFQDAR